jgi:transposase
VILETCAEAFSVADAVLALGHEVRVVPATLVRTLGVGARSMKTDVRDARVLSEVSCRIDLPSVHLPTELARQRRSMCGMREELVACRTALVNCARGWARAQVLRIRTGQPETFPQRMRAATLARPEGLPEYVERVLVVIESLNGQLNLADKELNQLARRDPLCERLMSVPGVGPVTSLRFVAALDDIWLLAHIRVQDAELAKFLRQQRRGGVVIPFPDVQALKRKGAIPRDFDDDIALAV